MFRRSKEVHLSFITEVFFISGHACVSFRLRKSYSIISLGWGAALLAGSADGFYLELFSVFLLQCCFQLCYYKNNVLYLEIS